MRIRRKWALAAAALATLPIAIWLAAYFFAPSVDAESVRAEILALTPLGSSVEEIDKAILATTGKDAFWQFYEKTGKKYRTEVAYRTYHQRKHLPWNCSLVVHWHLDDQERLREIELKYYVVNPWVMKEIAPP